jgi:NAD(P)-dependent dehydrogenase (short-subunit alcohol dehydrogenase family)
MTSKPLEGRVALVTGASRGLGYACACALSDAGAHVVATARTQGGLEDLDDRIRRSGGEGATLVPLDIKDGSALDHLGRAIFDRWGRLDILVSAAGDLGLITPIAHVEPKIWDRALAVNLTANYRLLRSMDPLLRQAPAARAVFLTSALGAEGRAFWGPYAVAKAGLEMLVRTYNDEVAHTAVRCALLDPGPMRTRLRAQAFPGEDPEDVPAPDTIAATLLELVRIDKDPPERTLHAAPVAAQE